MGRRTNKLYGNSELLAKVLAILRNKKAGKRICKDFANFFFEFEDTRKAFLLLNNENPNKGPDEKIS